MNKIEKQLKQERERASPSREFRSELWSKLSQSYDATHPVSRVFSPWFRFAAVGVTALALFVTTGVGVYAYESPDVVDGHVLYPVKGQLEKLEGRFAVSAEARARFHAKMMARRLEEAERHQQNMAILQRLVPKIAEELELTRAELRERVSDPVERQLLLQELEAQNARYAEIIVRVGESEQELRENGIAPLQLPEEVQVEVERLKVEAREQELTPRQQREYLKSQLKPFLNEIRLERLEEQSSDDAEVKASVEVEGQQESSVADLEENIEADAVLEIRGTVLDRQDADF